MLEKDGGYRKGMECAGEEWDGECHSGTESDVEGRRVPERDRGCQKRTECRRGMMGAKKDRGAGEGRAEVKKSKNLPQTQILNEPLHNSFFLT